MQKAETARPRDPSFRTFHQTNTPLSGKSVRGTHHALFGHGLRRSDSRTAVRVVVATTDHTGMCCAVATSARVRGEVTARLPEEDMFFVCVV